MRGRIAALVACVALVVTLTPVQRALAAPPGNDAVETPALLSGQVLTATGSNAEATLQADEPAHAGNAGGASVWFSWTAPADGTVTVDTQGSNFNTLLAVYTGGPVFPAFHLEASNDDESGSVQTSAVSFSATGSTEYLIAVDGFNAGAAAATGAITLTINRPTVTSISPATGSVGSTVIITGTNFVDVSAVTFGTPAAFTEDSPTQISAIVPADAVSGPVTVTTPAGTATSATSFTLPAPTVTSFTPSSGSPGTSVTITGSDFYGVTSVKFNGVAAAFTDVTPTQITATVPSNATTGPVSVTATAGTGTSATSFTVPGPTVSSFTPTGGPAGTTVTITGADFYGVTSVKFNGVAAAFTVDLPTQITATVPTGATTGPISVTAVTGTGASAANFLVMRVSSFSPTSGRPGSIVSVSGTGLVGATSVSIGGIETSFLEDADGRLTAVVPTGAVTGVIRVVGPLGLASSSSSFTALSPVVTAVSLSGTTFTPKQALSTAAVRVNWSFKGPNTHSVVDTSGLSLFNSGPKAPNTVFGFVFSTAGTYPYKDGSSTGTGSVGVRPTVVLRADGKIDVVVSSVVPTAPLAYDIQVQAPGASAYVPWLTGYTSRLARFTPEAGNGFYRFQARLRNTISNAATGWSPVVQVQTGAGYLTLMFGRSQWQAVDTSCNPLPGAVPLDQVSDALVARGRRPTGAVILSRTRETTRYCDKLARYTSWADLAQLRDQDGWTFVSAGVNYVDVTQLTREQQQANTCGSLSAFVNHGHLKAWGLYAYPNNKSNTDVQSNVVSTCFAYGRKYGTGTVAFGALTPPWFQQTKTVNGGPCNDRALPCYNYPAVRTKRYLTPVALGNLMNPKPGVWNTVQMYRLVTGSFSNTNHKWDCTSSDWRAHWTNQHELYCFNDYLMALDAIKPAVVVADPATVATNLGRALG